MNKFLVVLNIIVFQIGLFVLFPISEPKPRVIPQLPPVSINYTIADPIPDYLDYAGTVNKMLEWSRDCPALALVGTYGKSGSGKDLCYLKIGSSGPVVLITACIHGNEVLSASTTMGYIGTLLDRYGDDPEITSLLNSRQIYFVPVASPDSYPNSRNVGGLDPNRNFDNKNSETCVQALKDFFLKIQPVAVLSGHTHGRMYLKPWGNRHELCPDDSEYERILDHMSKNGYRIIKGSELYSNLMFGSELDWYCKHGAFSIVVEYGTHQRIPTTAEIRKEFDLTFKEFLYFVKEASVIDKFSVLELSVQ